MAFDAASAAIGALITIVLMLLWRWYSKRTSFYAAIPDFPVTLSVEAAKALYDATFKTMSDELDSQIKAAKEAKDSEKELMMWKEGRNVLNELSNKYDEFLFNKQNSMPQKDILHPEAQAAPEAPAAPAA